MPDPDTGNLNDEAFREIVDSLDAIWVMSAVRDDEGRIVDFRYEYVNPAGVRLLGEQRDDVVGHRLLELYPSTVELGIFDTYRSVVETGEELVSELPWFDERHVHGLFEVRITRFGDGYLGWARDISEAKRAERRIIEDEALLRAALDSSSDGIIRYGADLRIDYVNDRVLRLTGTTREAWLGKSNAELGHPDGHIRRVFDTAEKVVYQFETDNLEGHRWYESVVSPQFSGDGSVSHALAVSRDITDRELATQQLSDLATHDPLTGLANRPTLLDEIHRALESGPRSGHRTGLLMIDLDHFKNVNDTLGHATGDDLLVEAARRLAKTVRAGDLLARQGGDEFVVVMRDLDDEVEAMHVAERIVAEFRRPLLAAGLELSTTASVGVTLSEPDASVDADDLLREADTAMYVAKDDGRDQAAMFNAELRSAVSERRLLEEDLRHALPRDELAVWYQPEIDLGDGSIRAVEALLRWHHPSGQLYRASRFIDIAESTGLIVPIGNWSLGEVGARAIRWSAARPDRPLTVRVNLSALQLAEAGLLDDLDHLLATPGLDPRMLCVEIRESALLQDIGTVRANLAGIRARGISVAIDNFGTGYGSLSSLHDHEVDAVMLDRSLVAHLATDDDALELVTGIVDLAHHLEIRVTGEGVEHADQAQILHDLGCIGAQGFLYFDAVPPQRVDRLLGIEAPPD